MQKILVTGWSGMIGSAFVEEMPGVKLFQGDITRGEDVIRNLRDIDIVINFAAFTYLPASWDMPQEWMNVNLGGVMNFLGNNRLFKKFVQMSTALVYGNGPSPFKVGDATRPNNLYGTMKLAAELAIQNYAERTGMEYLILRSFNNYGPRQSRYFVVPTFCQQAMKGKITIKGNTERDFVYVKDTARLLRRYLEEDAVGIKQVATEQPTRIKRVAEIIAAEAGAEVEVGPSERKDDIDSVWGLSDAPADFRWTPVEQGLRETFDYYRQQA